MRLSKLTSAISDKDLRAELTGKMSAENVSAFESSINAYDKITHKAWASGGVRKD